MAGPPNSPLSMLEILKAEDGLTDSPAPSPRVQKLKPRVEKLQLSPSTIAQIKDRSPGTPSSLNRSLSRQELRKKRAQVITSPTGLVKERHSGTPASFVEYLRAEEEEEEESLSSGFSLKEFLQEDKRKENDEVIDKIIAKVSEGTLDIPSSPKKSLRHRRPRVGKLGLRLISMGHTKSERSEPQALVKDTPKVDDGGHVTITRVTQPVPDIQFSMDHLFNDGGEQQDTVGGMTSPAGNGLSILEFLQQENGRHGRPDSPTLPNECEGLGTIEEDRDKGNSARLGLRDDDDVFKISARNFSSRQERKNGSLQLRPPSLFFQKYDIDILPGLPAQILNKDSDFLTSTVAALRSVSSTDTPTPKSALAARSPRRHNGMALMLQRAASVASNATKSLSDASSTKVVEQIKRHSITSLAEKRLSIASISTTTTGSLSLSRSLTVKKLRTWKEFSVPGTPGTPGIFTPKTPQVPTCDEVSEELKEKIRKSVGEAKAALEPKLLQFDLNDIEFAKLWEEDREAQKDEEEMKLNEKEKQREWENALVALSGSQEWAVTLSRPTSSAAENVVTASFTSKASSVAPVDELYPLPTEPDFKSSTPFTSRPETPISPSFLSRTPSMAAFPLFSPTSNSTSFSRPDTAASFSFASRLSSRRPSATASVGATNPFGPLLYWDRPEGTVNEEDLEYVKNIRYYAHDLVQGDLRKAYGERKRTQSATDVTRGYLNALNAKFTSEVVLEYPEGGSRNDGQFSDMDMDKDHLRAAWAVRFLERCEQNGW